MFPIAIALPERRAYSQTFVHQQVEGLPFDIHLLYGGNLPTHHARTLDGAGYAFPGENADPWIRTQAIAEYLREHRIAAVLCQFGPTGVEMMPACTEARVPLLVHFHGYDAWRRDVLGHYGRRYPALFEQAHGVVGVSREMCRQLVDLGAPPNRVHHLCYGVDTHRFADADPATAGPDFLMVGRQVDKKGQLPALLAFADVLRTDPDCRLRIIGGGPLRETGEMLAQALGIRTQVRWLEIQTPAGIALELRKSRALVQFSQITPSGDREGTPVAVLEAMSSGVPVIGTRHAGIPDVIDDGIEGLLVDPFDIAGLSNRLRLLAREPELAARLGAAARQRIVRHHTQELYLEHLATLIRRAAQHAPPPAQGPT